MEDGQHCVGRNNKGQHYIGKSEGAKKDEHHKGSELQPHHWSGKCLCIYVFSIILQVYLYIHTPFIIL